MLVAWNQQWWEYVLIPISPKMQLLNTYWDDTKISFIIPVSSSSCSSLKGSSDYKNIAFFKIGNLSMFYTAKYLLTTWPRNSTQSIYIGNYILKVTVLFLIQLRNAKQFSRIFIPLTTPTSSMWVPVAPHSHQHFC